jgi:dTDP-4-amino-4,6-dideoxygalactose transaminase
MKKIPFSPPDISDLEINEVINTLRSGWITTGPKTKEFEKRLSEYTGTRKTVCLNSWTAAMELCLRILDIGPGDEVITSAYTYTASASVIHHVGAKIVLVDTKPNSWEMDYDQLKSKISEKTKAIIPVDIGGNLCDYDTLNLIINEMKHLFVPTENIFQKHIGRIVILSDAAHSFGAQYKKRSSATNADFTAYSFHAVKNLTTAEGGSITWKKIEGIDDDYIYNQFQLFSLHGQNKDALSKAKPGLWEYDIIFPGFKCNMTDILASLGLAQLERYNSLMLRRKELYYLYLQNLNSKLIEVIPHIDSSYHLFLVRINNSNEIKRNLVIYELAKFGISTNVHYKPLPLFTAYKNLGFDISNFPNSFNFYQNEISLPFHTLLSNEDVIYVSKKLNEILSKF